VAHSFTAKTVHNRAGPEMTSGEFHSIEINSLIINRGERQRQRLKKAQLKELADDRQLPGRTARGEELSFSRGRNDAWLDNTRAARDEAIAR
jgi:hypothetical protein